MERFGYERELNHVIDSESLNANGICKDSKVSVMLLDGKNLVRSFRGVDSEDHESQIIVKLNHEIIGENDNVKGDNPVFNDEHCE